MQIARPVILQLLILSALFGLRTVAQGVAAETCDVPLVVSGWDNSVKKVEVLKILAPANLSIKLAGQSAPLLSAAIDGSPKRVVLVFDSSTKVADEEWRLAIEMAEMLLRNARANDKFVFLTVDSEEQNSDFVSAQEAIAHLQLLKSARPADKQAIGKIYDAMLQATEFLASPKFGDSIFFFGRTEDSGSTADPEMVRRILLQRRISLYGVSFEEVPLVNSFTKGKPDPQLASDFVPAKLDEISHDTGHYISYRNPRDFTGRQRRYVEEYFADLYAGIAEPYRLQIAAKSTPESRPLWIKVKKLKGYKVQQDDVRYPHSLLACNAYAPNLP